VSVCIDTSAFFAVIDADDEKHGSAASTWQDLLRRKETIFTTSYVVSETIALVHRRLGTDVVRRFVDDNLAVVEVHWIDEATHNAALTVAGRRGPSLTDCANISVMRRLRTRRIFAYDRHYAELGFEVLG
jgi:predicted nucleic acid-binding protein